MSAAGGASEPQQKALASDDLVQRARREISEIIREVTLLSRQAIPRNAFFATLLDRTVCAIAAQGAVIWDCKNGDPVAIVRTGMHTDASIKPFGVATHSCLVLEIASRRSPAVVPPTPDATDPNLPSNPTVFPAAMVPILDLASADDNGVLGAPRFVVEVFLEDEAGVSTQRGYLRFITQLCDLASEFLRADETRLSRRRESLNQQWLQTLNRLHTLKTSAAVEAEIVDATALMFDCARVSLARMHGLSVKLTAVSHVETIDRRGQACRELVKQIESLEFQDRSNLVDCTIAPNSTTNIVADSDIDASLYCLAATRSVDDQFRLLLQTRESKEFDSVASQSLEQWSRQAFAVLTDRTRFESIPLAKAYLALAPTALTIAPSRYRRVFALLGGVAVSVMIAMIPVPMTVTVPATLRPKDTRTHYAPADAVIEAVEVKHGQSIAKGDTLIILRDWALDEQTTTLLARRNVISQRLQRSIASLVEVPSTQYPKSDRSSTSDEELVQQQRLLEEEIAGLDEQLELFRAASDRLTIRADRDGIVDAWQTELTAMGRPVRRGDALIRVEPVRATWMVDAKVQQSRIGIVLDQFDEDPGTTAKVATIARPERVFFAKFSRRSTVIDWEANTTQADKDSKTLGVELKIESSSVDKLDENWTYGAPVTATIECGKRPLIEVVFYDLVRAVTRTWARWI